MAFLDFSRFLYLALVGSDKFHNRLGSAWHSVLLGSDTFPNWLYSALALFIGGTVSLGLVL